MKKKGAATANAMQYEWDDPPAPFNGHFVPNYKEMNAEIHSIVAKGEPYKDRAARASAWSEAYKVVRPKYKSIKELENEKEQE